MYALECLNEDNPFDVSQAFYKSFLDQILGEKKNDFQYEWGIPAMRKQGLPKSVMVHIARQLFSNFQVHAQALLERLVRELSQRTI